MAFTTGSDAGTVAGLGLAAKFLTPLAGIISGTSALLGLAALFGAGTFNS